jgi:hypothetical protein
VWLKTGLSDISFKIKPQFLIMETGVETSVETAQPFVWDVMSGVWQASLNVNVSANDNIKPVL